MSTDNFEHDFDAALDKFEQLLGDLMGVETVAEVLRDFVTKTVQDGTNVAPTSFALRMPTSDPFTVYPTLPTESAVDWGSGPDGYQAWVDSVFEIGKGGAAATSSWLKVVTDNYDQVDATAIIDAAMDQSRVIHKVGTEVDELIGEVAGNLAAHWKGDAKEEFFEWFAEASAVVGALLLYADSAQLAAGAAGDVIRATQRLLFKQAEGGRDAVEKALDAWRSDNDAFPFPPGSGYPISQLGTVISEKIDEYTAQIPAGGTVVRFGIKKALAKVPPASAAVKAYNVLAKLDARDEVVATPATASALSSALEEGLRAIAKDGDKALAKLGDPITAVARAVASDDALTLDRLPRDPGGTYTA